MYILQMSRGDYEGEFIVFDDGEDVESIVADLEAGNCGGWSLHWKDATILATPEEALFLQQRFRILRDLRVRILSVIDPGIAEEET